MSPICEAFCYVGSRSTARPVQNRHVSTPAGLRVVAVSGSPTHPSKTASLVTEIAGNHAAGVWRAQLGPSAQAALDLVESADVIVVGSPAYRATYTGLFKLFFDQVGQLALVDKPVLLASTAGAAGDAALVEHHLRALFSFFQSRILPVAVATDDSGFTAVERDASVI
jgi:FMN reductase